MKEIINDVRKGLKTGIFGFYRFFATILFLLILFALFFLLTECSKMI